MNSKAIVGLSLIAALTATMVLAQSVSAVPASHLTIEKSVVGHAGKNLNIAILTGGEIPTDGSSGAFGYGVITGFKKGAPENVLALTTHMCAADHFDQSDNGDCPDGTIGLLTALGLGDNEDHNGPEFHAHVLDLTSPTLACSGFDAEVDLARTLKTKNNVIANYPVTVIGNGIVVEEVPIKDLHDATVEAIVAFTITPVASGSDITNLCLDIQ